VKANWKRSMQTEVPGGGSVGDIDCVVCGGGSPFDDFSGFSVFPVAGVLAGVPAGVGAGVDAGVPEGVTGADRVTVLDGVYEGVREFDKERSTPMM